MASMGVTGEDTAPPGGGPVRPSDRSSGGRLAGKIAEFGDRVFLADDKRAVEKYLTTTEYLAEYVGRTYGRELKNLVKYHREPTFTMPIEPNARELGAIMERYKAELAQVHREMSDYKKNKGLVFELILGQCDGNVVSKLEETVDPGSTSRWARNLDVHGGAL